jgi:hypothetical protein
MDSALILSLRQAYKRMATAGEEYIEATLAYASLLLEARRRQPSNQAFALWLAEHDLDDLPKNERAALLNIAEYPDLFRECAAESRRRSVELIWFVEMQSRLPNARKMDVSSTNAVIPECGAEDSADSGKGDPAKSELPSNATPSISTHQALRTPFRGLPHYKDVLALVQHKATRSMLAGLMKKKGGRAIWDLLVEAIQQGIFGPPSSAVVSKPNLRLIFPWAPSAYAQKFNLLEREDLVDVREKILPVVIAHRETVLREPDQLVPLLTEASAIKRQAALEAKQTEQIAKRLAAVDALPITEKAIVMYGAALWPPVPPTPAPPWSYQELLQACYFYEVLEPMLRAVSIHTKQIHTAQSTMQAIYNVLKFLPLPFRESPFVQAVRQINLAYAANPDGACQRAPAHANYGLTA